MLPISAAVCAKLLQLEQKSLLNKFKNLNEFSLKTHNFKILREENRRRRSSSTSLTDSLSESWPQYLRLNFSLLENCKKVESYGRFWSLQMSVAFVAQIFKMCYEVFALMRFGHSMNGLQKFYFIVYPAYYTAIMLWYVGHCTQLDRVNEEVSKQCLKYHNRELSKSGPSESCLKLPLTCKLKAELFAQNGRLEGYVLKLFAGYRVNSNTLVEVI